MSRAKVFLAVFFKSAVENSHRVWSLYSRNVILQSYRSHVAKKKKERKTMYWFGGIWQALRSAPFPALCASSSLTECPSAVDMSLISATAFLFPLHGLLLVRNTSCWTRITLVLCVLSGDYKKTRSYHGCWRWRRQYIFLSRIEHMTCVTTHPLKDMLSRKG